MRFGVRNKKLLLILLCVVIIIVGVVVALWYPQPPPEEQGQPPPQVPPKIHKLLACAICNEKVYFLNLTDASFVEYPFATVPKASTYALVSQKNLLFVAAGNQIIKIDFSNQTTMSQTIEGNLAIRKLLLFNGKIYAVVSDYSLATAKVVILNLTDLNLLAEIPIEEAGGYAYDLLPVQENFYIPTFNSSSGEAYLLKLDSNFNVINRVETNLVSPAEVILVNNRLILRGADKIQLYDLDLTLLKEAPAIFGDGSIINDGNILYVAGSNLTGAPCLYILTLEDNTIRINKTISLANASGKAFHVVKVNSTLYVVTWDWATNSTIKKIDGENIETIAIPTTGNNWPVPMATGAVYLEVEEEQE